MCFMRKAYARGAYACVCLFELTPCINGLVGARCEAMKESPLNPAHAKLGAQMSQVDGWNMPRAFRSLVEEHLSARSECAVFDISHISKFRVCGNGALGWLEKIFGRGVTSCHDGAIVRAQLLGTQGRALDTLTLLRESAGSFYLLGHAAAEEAVYAWLREQRAHAAIELRRVTEEWCAMALLGPQGDEVLHRALRGVELPRERRFTHLYYQRQEIMLARFALQEYPHLDSPEACEFLCPAVAGISWYETFIAAGAQPCGSAARETLRLRY